MSFIVPFCIMSTFTVDTSKGNFSCFLLRVVQMETLSQPLAKNTELGFSVNTNPPAS